MSKVLKKIIPESFTLNTASKPMHSGEVYYIWEILTAGYQIIGLLEFFQMITKDKELHQLLQTAVTETYLAKIEKLEKLLKDAGFTVPPRPASKTKQGKPGVAQQVSLSDEEIIKAIYQMTDVNLNLEGRAIGTVTSSEKIREALIDIFNADVMGFDIVQKYAIQRQAIFYPPNATTSPNGLNLNEVSILWLELDYRYTSVIMLETLMLNTNDEDLVNLLDFGLKKIAYPQMEKIENILKNEGFTVPPRPVERKNQQPPGKTNLILIRDNEVISLLVTAAQSALNKHIGFYTLALRNDLKGFFRDMISTEINNLQKAVKLAQKRNILEIPPRTTSKQA